jgi:hypothetical protein
MSMKEESPITFWTIILLIGTVWGLVPNITYLEAGIGSFATTMIFILIVNKGE